MEVTVPRVVLSGRGEGGHGVRSRCCTPGLLPLARSTSSPGSPRRWQLSTPMNIQSHAVQNLPPNKEELGNPQAEVCTQESWQNGSGQIRTGVLCKAHQNRLSIKESTEEPE
ncbi:hypothetical protein SKAU_G00387590 [Synaphobranchus kaupii]|uniref:Uncharacterized protein n=1 Tax=Synaphobranchus kaupii TaxID=118154 RepID=A0A9Q1IDA7_SYNKA|nr:hypothetical protein SKAU_G00387590 [Synaphobranchus kaupii]